MFALLDNGQLKSVIMKCSFSTEEYSCSESGVGSAIFPLLACKRDMTSHLVSLGISEPLPGVLGNKGTRTFILRELAYFQIIFREQGNS